MNCLKAQQVFLISTAGLLTLHWFVVRVGLSLCICSCSLIVSNRNGHLLVQLKKDLLEGCWVVDGIEEKAGQAGYGSMKIFVGSW